MLAQRYFLFMGSARKEYFLPRFLGVLSYVPGRPEVFIMQDLGYLSYLDDFRLAKSCYDHTQGPASVMVTCFLLDGVFKINDVRQGVATSSSQTLNVKSAKRP